MFTDKHYVPAIRWRQGEYGALEELSAAHKEYITPLVDVPPIPWDFAEDQHAKTIDQHLSRIPSQMSRAWGIDAPIFVDLGLIDETERMASGRHPVDDLFERLDADGVQAIPVIATDRDNAYLTAVRSVIARDGRGVCLRASIDDLSDPSAIGILDGIPLEIEISLDQVDLVLDFRSVESSQVALVRTLITSALPMIPNLANYRTLTVLSGAFPVNLSAVAQGISLLPRSDWALWLSLRSVSLPRQPSFGDYTASHPEQEELDPRIMQASASIRYASDSDWVIARGRSVKSPRFGGFAQYRTLSSALMSHPMFTGHSFSWASDFITQCASGGSTGNLTSWRKVATNRHMARVAHQISNLP